MSWSTSADFKPTKAPATKSAISNTVTGCSFSPSAPVGKPVQFGLVAGGRRTTSWASSLTIPDPVYETISDLMTDACYSASFYRAGPKKPHKPYLWLV